MYIHTYLDIFDTSEGYFMLLSKFKPIQSLPPLKIK